MKKLFTLLVLVAGLTTFAYYELPMFHQASLMVDTADRVFHKGDKVIVTGMDTYAEARGVTVHTIGEISQYQGKALLTGCDKYQIRWTYPDGSGYFELSNCCDSRIYKVK